MKRADRQKFEKICRDIKSVKIQGATNIAKAAIKAYLINPTEKTKKILFNLRPTEPMLQNSLNYLEKWPEEKILLHFNSAQEKINKLVFKLIKGNPTIFTHCHSTNVLKALFYAKRKGKKFSVVNTETRPLFQGRITARELARAKIPVTTYVDSAAHEAIEETGIVFVGADAVLKNGVINKIGSNMIAELAFVHKIPFYVVADSWKFYPRNIRIEERDFHEVWKNAPKKVKVKNPAFEKIEPKYIKGVVSELGILSFKEFIKKAERNHKLLK